MLATLFAAPALASVPFSGNVCAIPTAAELAAAEITGTCVQGQPSKSTGGGVVAHKYTDHWGTAPAESDLPAQTPFLSIEISRLTGPRTKLAKDEKYEDHVISGNFGAIKLGDPVKIGGKPGNIAKGTELLFLSGHLYIVLIRLKRPAKADGDEAAEALTHEHELVALGNSALAAL